MYLLETTLASIAFLLGAIPVGYLVGRALGRDLRSEGSGNTGATNAGRVLGKKAGIITLVGDIAKGVAAVLLAELADRTLGSQLTLKHFLGFCAVLGHCYSPFLGFRGGKGVATGFGTFLALDPVSASAAAGLFALVFKLTRIVSLSSLVAALSVGVFISFRLANYPFWPACSAALLTWLTTLIVVYRHKENISRLRSRTEPHFAPATKG